MELARPRFVPDPSLSTADMEACQRDIADVAAFTDDVAFDTAAVSLDGPAGQTTLGEQPGNGTNTEAPLVAGVDQAFVDDRAVSAIVILRGREVVERVYAVEQTEIPYIPGLLSFREGGAVLAAFEALEHDPDIVFLDGSGRIHYREAGLATHIGVTLNVPAIGVAKNLLCGRPRESLDRKLPEGARVPIEADAEVEPGGAAETRRADGEAAEEPVIGYAVQSRQYDSESRYINPLIVSPGHRVSAETAADLVLATAAGYKLPEPTRLADTYADSVKTEI
jgi:deoxyribonuclease V